MTTNAQALTKKNILEAISLEMFSLSAKISNKMESLAKARQKMLRSNDPELVALASKIEAEFRDLVFKRKALEDAAVQINNGFGW